jgi:ELWxxDGT repeat protein/VCBS repeat-containing protein
MRVSTWLRSLAALLTPAHSRRTPRRPAFRPRVETLEDRTTPSVVQLTDPSINLVSGPTNLTPVGSTLYFVADDGTHGTELWRTAGRPGDAARVEGGHLNFDPVSGGLVPELARIGPWLYYFTDNGDFTYTLWRNDITASPADGISPSEAILTIPGPTNDWHPYQLTAVGNDLYFGAYSFTDTAWELWKVAGADTLSGDIPAARRFQSSGPDLIDSNGPSGITAAGSNLYFDADAPGTTNQVLWGSDGTPGGTAPVRDASGGYVVQLDTSWKAVGTDLYVIEGLWDTYGNLSSGTLYRVSGLGATAIASVGGPTGTPYNGPGYFMTVAGDSVYFLAGGGPGNESGSALWKCEGSTASEVWQSQPGRGEFPLQIAAIGSDVYFTDSSGDRVTRDLWKSNGTPEGTELIKSFELAVDFNGSGSIPIGLTPVGSTLYFEGPDGRLWQSGGTPETTHSTGVILGGVGGQASFVVYESYGYYSQDYPGATSPFAAVGSTLYISPLAFYGGVGQLWRLNNPPVAAAEAYTADQDTALTVPTATGVLANDTDPDAADAGHLTAALVNDATHGHVTLNADGSFTYTPNAGYVGPDSFTYQASDGIDASNDATVSLNVLISQTGVQDALNSIDTSTGTPTITLDATDPAQASSFVSLFDPNSPGYTALTAPAGATAQNPVQIVATLPPDFNLTNYTAVIPDGIQVWINGGLWDPDLSALTLTSGDLIITGAKFVTTGDAPTILVTGGHLTLRNDVIEESTGSSQPAISVTGGTVDLGTADDPGNNRVNVNGSGTFLRNTTGHPIADFGNTFAVDGTATAGPIALTVTVNSSLMRVGNSPPPLTGFVNGTPFTGAITITTPYGDQVTVTLVTTATAGSPVDQYDITAVLSGPGADNYAIDPATSHFGTLYVVSVGADPSSTTGAQAVTFWDNKGNARLITAADLSSLDALNLVTQGGSAFDPRSVAQLEAWLVTPPNATAAYQLAVQLAALDLNVLAGNVHATDLVYAGGLLPYASTYNIAGLTSGGFIDVQDLMNAANAVLAQVSPGALANDPNQAYEAALTQVLQAVNGNSDFVKQELNWNLINLYLLGLLA